MLTYALLWFSVTALVWCGHSRTTASGSIVLGGAVCGIVYSLAEIIS